MTDLTLCNYCILKALRAAAKEQGEYIRVREAGGELGGVNVYQVPNCVQYYDLRAGTEEHDKYFKGWYMAIGDHCVC